MPVSHKHRSSVGHSHIVGVVHEKVGAKYTVLCHAGVLEKAIPRNGLHFQEKMKPAHLAIEQGLAELPRIKEANALGLMNRLVKTAVFCSCKQVY